MDIFQSNINIVRFIFRTFIMIEDSKIWPRIFFLLVTLYSIEGAVTKLSHSNFANGTYRICTPGKYKLMEDIDFEPRPDNDHWNPLDDPNYPINQFYMGFFAAITIESNDVVVDLNGHTLQMSKKFYLLQRFFNVIEVKCFGIIPARQLSLQGLGSNN